MDTVGQRIRAHRERLGLTQEKLARAAGITGMTVSNIERGAGGVPRWTTIEAVARAMALDPVSLVAGVTMPAPLKRETKPAAREVA